ncbi:MAG: cation:proton antiporter [Actinomycetota bacterium]
MTEHEVFVLLVEIVILVLAARAGGEVAARLGVPLVVGELAFGILLGPSLLGALWPEAFRALFPADPFQRGVLEVLALVGVIFLVILTGLETRLGVLREAKRALILGWAGAFLVPFAAGFLFGLWIPASFVGSQVDRPVFALFVATAMSISAIPVIARILWDMKMLRSRVGAVILSTALADDTIGWVMLGITAGLVGGSGLSAVALVRTVGATAAFIVVAFTVGKRAVEWVVRASDKARAPQAQASVMLLLVLTAGAITQAIGVHLVLGVFIVSILIGRVKGRDRSCDEAIRQVGMGFFIPLFFAYTGLKVDLTLLTGSSAAIAVAAVAVASLSKIIGGGVGTLMGGMGRWEAAAVGVGLNARGAMGLIIATIGVSLGIITSAMYSILVLIALVTSLMAAPMLRFCLRRSVAVAAPPANAEPARRDDNDPAEPIGTSAGGVL